MALALVMTARADNGVDDNLFVYFKDGSVEAFPSAWITSQDISGGVLRIAIDKNYFSYEMSKVDSLSHIAPKDLPSVVSLKFNNKYNDQLFTDAIATIHEYGIISATVGGIGKWLTPSFQLSSDEAIASIGGKIQKSHVTRSNFAEDVTFTVAHANQSILDRTKVSDEVWSEPEKYIFTKVLLTEDMLSTNAPTNEGEGLGMMIDGDPATYFHPSNGNDNTAPDPYFDIHLDEGANMIQFGYTLRKDLSRYPKELRLYASKDGNDWTLKETYTRETGLPYKVGETFTSPLIDLGDTYPYLRILQTQANYKKNLFFVEFELSKVTENPDTIPVLIQPTVYDYHFIPWGRDYLVHIDWLTNMAENVPRVDIDIEDGKFVSSKDYYLNAEINITGNYVYPSMSDKVQIKGRGNSSWSRYEWDKNPYRLKFAEKVKPFGMTKGKNWVLLANKQEGSMMTNAIGMKIAAVVGTAAYNHIIPVELYMNGYYWGSYNFTEKIGFHNNSIDLEEEQNAALLELDTYYDEVYRFHSDPYNLPVNIKIPDLNEQGSNLDFNIIKEDF
ncbi:MAG: CotH kinase family protein, partial [Prevotella sp.]|nr:CotH kinase family protein [Prevotella sp.]